MDMAELNFLDLIESTCVLGFIAPQMDLGPLMYKIRIRHIWDQI